jgi:hypothetical protein
MFFYEKSIGIQQFLATYNLTIYGVNKVFAIGVFPERQLSLIKD